jgi:hypothetical protein
MITATFKLNILGYSDAAQLQRRSTHAVTELVLRWSVHWPNRLGWRQKVLQPPSNFMFLSWWCPLGHGKRRLPAIQIFIAVRLIPILTHLSSRWTVPLKPNNICISEELRMEGLNSAYTLCQYFCGGCGNMIFELWLFDLGATYVLIENLLE